MPRISRRELLVGVGVGVAVATAGRAVAQGGSTRLILLGTGGGPRPRAASSASAQVLICNGAAYVIDCGDGVATRHAAPRVPHAPTLRPQRRLRKPSAARLDRRPGSSWR